MSISPAGFTQTISGVLNVKVGGLQAHSLIGWPYPRFVVWPKTVNVTLANNFIPPANSAYQVITWPSHIGTLNVNSPFFSGGYPLQPQYQTTGLTLLAGASPPVVTSANISATVGTSFNFQINATNSPTLFAAANLPAGLSIHPPSGVIAGIPKVAGNFNISISATNKGGTGTGLLTLSIASGPFSKLQILVPGETAAPGTVSGKTGNPTIQSPTFPFSLKVNAVDQYWNIVASVSDVVAFASTDASASVPTSSILTSGSLTVMPSLGASGNWTFTATDQADTNKTMESAPIQVSAGVFAKLQVILPGETAAPGTFTGKTGTPLPRIAGVPFSMTINAVDATWTVVGSVADQFTLTSSDGFAVIPSNLQFTSGKASVLLSPRTAGSQTIKAADLTDNTKTEGIAFVQVNPGPLAKLLVVLPGETASPGSDNGLSGAPNSVSANESFNITTFSVDSCWNTVDSNDMLTFSSTDTQAVLPQGVLLVSGAAVTQIRLKSYGLQQITAFSAASNISGTSGSILVKAVPILTSPAIDGVFDQSFSLYYPGSGNQSVQFRIELSRMVS